jgi:methionyl-tRNA synthetase
MNKTPAPERQILVTSALPYANGAIHLGHMVEYIQSDIWVRFQKLRYVLCYHICGNDAHGTPIMIRAQKENISPETLVQRVHEEQAKDFQDFHIAFDNFYTTHSSENQILSNDIYQKLQKNNDIVTKTIEQSYDPIQNMFLPDRFVKGECPKCGAADQYGDSCEACGATYSPTELKNPVSTLTGATPILKQTDHAFFKLENYAEKLKNWTQSGHLQSQITNKLGEWFESGLKSWDITRDAPYFGFPIPGLVDKYFYVWLDAPIGYMASFKNYCDKNNVDFNAFWNQDSTTELYHFIGKDIVYFHALFWPAMLMGANYRTPTAIFAHGFLTVDGQKMSKSRGTFITARQYLNHLNPDYLRYYFAAKLGSGVDDIDLNFQDFIQRVNSDLVNKFVNIGSRLGAILTKQFEGKMGANLDKPELYDSFVKQADSIATSFEQREYHKAIREIMALADLANQYVDQEKPWALIKTPETRDKALAVCTLGLNLFKILSTYLKPVVPDLISKTEQFFNQGQFTWENIAEPILNQTLNPFTPLLTRIDIKQVELIMQEAQANQDQTPEQTPTQTIEPISELINIDDFGKIDLRVAKIINAEAVPEAEKLLKLTLDIGEGRHRQVFAGIKSAYQPEALIGKFTVMVANLAPRKMRFGISEGMVLAAKDPKAPGLYILEPHEGATPGMRVQ